MGRLLKISILCALIPAHLPAQLASRAYFEERLLDRAPVIVRARFASDQSCFDVDVAAFKVIRRLRGEVDDRLLVLGATQLSQRFKDVDRLLFLRREPSGCLYRIVDVIDLVEEADATEAFVRGFLVLAAEVEPARRRAGLKQLIQDGLAMKTEFPRRLAARELLRLAGKVPPVLTMNELIDLAASAQAAPPDEIARIAAALEAAENALLKGFAGTQSSVPRGPRRDRYLRLVAGFIDEADPVRRDRAADQVALKYGDLAVPFLLRLLEDDSVRRRALIHLGALQSRAGVSPILLRLNGGTEDPGPMIICLGEIGDEAAVPALSRYLSSADQFEAAVLALVRIGTPASIRMLDAMAAQLRRDPRQQPRIEVIERMRSREFVDEDSARRLEAKGRYSRE